MNQQKQNKMTLKGTSYNVWKQTLSVILAKITLSYSCRSKLLNFSNKLYEIGHQSGSQYLINLIKSLRLTFYRYLAGDPYFSGDRLGRTKDGLPKLICHQLRQGWRLRNRDYIQGTLTILQLSYALVGNKEPDLTSVESPFDGDLEGMNSFRSFVKDHIHKILGHDIPLPRWEAPHMSLKSGPNGQALSSCGIDYQQLSEDQINDLKILGGPIFTNWFESWSSNPAILTKVTKFLNPSFEEPGISKRTTRKITYVDSPEGKKRVIAIFDYWSQSVLKPIHDWSFSILKRLSQDRTFNQGKDITALKGDIFYSFDLSAATDRFPLGIQQVVLDELIGNDISGAWGRLLTNTKFDISWSPGKKVSYSVGQPMGAYSSWGVFSLTHHLIVQYCAWKVGANLPFKQYMLLGDDIVISHKQVALTYKEIITKYLGVRISLEKSLVSKDTYEFAKRIIHRGIEMTHFPLQAVTQERNSIAGLWSVLLTAADRGYTFCESITRPGVVADLTTTLRDDLRRNFIKSHATSIECIHILSNKGSTQIEREWCYYSLPKSIGLNWSCNMRLESRESLLLTLIAHFSVMYKLDQISSLKSFSGLSFESISEDDSNAKTGTGSQTNIRIDVTLSPQIWNMQQELQKSQMQTSSLMMLRDSAGALEIIQSTGQTNSDVTRLVSRQVNRARSAQFSSFIKFIAEGIKSSNDSRREELNG